MRNQTFEEWKVEIEELVQDFIKSKQLKAGESKPANIVLRDCPTPQFNSQYEYLHFYDLDTNTTENGAIYDDCKWRYHYCQEPLPWEKCWQDDKN